MPSLFLPDAYRAETLRIGSAITILSTGALKPQRRPRRVKGENLAGRRLRL
jgi:hypothetical protein